MFHIKWSCCNRGQGWLDAFGGLRQEPKLRLFIYLRQKYTFGPYILSQFSFWSLLFCSAYVGSSKPKIVTILVTTVISINQLRWVGWRVLSSKTRLNQLDPNLTKSDHSSFFWQVFGQNTLDPTRFMPDSRIFHRI